MVETERFTSVEHTNLLILILRLLSVSGAVVWAIIPQLYLLHPDILHLIFIYNIIIAIYVLFFILRFFFPDDESSSSVFCFISFLFDEIVIAYFIYNTGGSNSPFYSGYFVVITLTAFVLGTRFAIFAALFGILTFIVSQTYYGLGLYNAIELFYRTFPLVIIAFPTGLLSDALKKHIGRVNQLNETLKSKNEELENSLRQIEAMQRQLLEREKEKAVLELTENIAHRLRNPIMSIGGMAEVLEKKMEKNPSVRDLKKYADYIKIESRKLSMLSDNLLQMSNMSVDLKFVSVPQVVKRVLSGFEMRLKREGIKLKVDIDNSIPPVRLDEQRLVIALKNIIENSIESMKNGGELFVGVKKRKREDREMIEIEITDSGIGMPQEMIDKLFKPFESGGDVKKGIGLPIAKHSIEIMGGMLEVTSRVGYGTTFKIVLPV